MAARAGTIPCRAFRVALAALVMVSASALASATPRVRTVAELAKPAPYGEWFTGYFTGEPAAAPNAPDLEYGYAFHWRKKDWPADQERVARHIRYNATQVVETEHHHLEITITPHSPGFLNVDYVETTDKKKPEASRAAQAGERAMTSVPRASETRSSNLPQIIGAIGFAIAAIVAAFRGKKPKPPNSDGGKDA